MSARRIVCAFAAAGGMTVPAAAQPVFSVGRSGPSGLPSDVLFDSSGGFPNDIGGGVGMGLGLPGDDINGLSQNAAALRAAKKFIICFSVDPFSVGTWPFRIPVFNVFNQAMNNQAAGDVFLSTEAFEQGVGLLPPPFSMGLFNNVLRVNQSPVYPTDFGLFPNASPWQHVPPGPLDDVNAALTLDPDPNAPVFFTLSTGSPSLFTLPGTGSAADIFVDHDVNTGGGEQLYAPFFALGLLEDDDIDGLIVFDENSDGWHDPGDEVYFTLAPGSPTLALLGLSPADVLLSSNRIVTLFAHRGWLGLLPDDNMSSLNAIPLVNDSAEDTINDLVPPLCPADFNGDTVVDSKDFLAFLNAFVNGDPAADCNGDTIINTQDFLCFLNLFTLGCD